MTHTYVVLQISKRAFAEIKKKLLDAGYVPYIKDNEHGLLLDMHGLALADQTFDPASIVPPPSADIDDVLGTPKSVIDRRPKGGAS